MTAAFSQESNIQPLIKRINFIDARHAAGSLKKQMASQKHEIRVFNTQICIARFSKDKQAIMEK